MREINGNTIKSSNLQKVTDIPFVTFSFVYATPFL